MFVQKHERNDGIFSIIDGDNSNVQLCMGYLN